MLKNFTKQIRKMFKLKKLIQFENIVSFILLIFVLGLGIQVIMTAYKILSKWLLPNINENFQGKKRFVLLHMNGCPYCVKMMNDWDEAANNNKTNIEMTKIERSDDGASEIMDKHGVRLFPTMLLLNGNKLIKKYDGERKKDAFLDFMRDNE
jgi:thioredoxin-related protein